jgi:hypothetical protein
MSGRRFHQEIKRPINEEMGLKVGSYVRPLATWVQLDIAVKTKLGIEASAYLLSELGTCT